MIEIRRAEDRGLADHGWLVSRHTFSFGAYHDPGFMGFRSLRVINDDRVQPGAGFPTHAHHDMEILSWVVSGALSHRDSLGHGSTIKPGDLQRMSAGTGVTHSEFNPSPGEPARFLQIWLLPERHGLAPGYEQRRFPATERRGSLRLIASPDGRDGSVTVRQDARLYASLLAPGERIRHDLAAGRGAWVQVVRGDVTLDRFELGEGDGASIEQASHVDLRCGATESELLLFDLA